MTVVFHGNMRTIRSKGRNNWRWPHRPAPSAVSGTSSWSSGVYVYPVCLSVLWPDSLPPRFIFLAPVFHYGLCGFLNCVFLAKAEVKKTLSTSALSMSCLTRAPVPFNSRPTFSTVFFQPLMYLWKLFLLLLTFLARVNSGWLWFFPKHVCLLRKSLYIYCRLPDPTSTFCILHFEVWVSSLIHTGPLTFLLDFLFFRMACS